MRKSGKRRLVFVAILVTGSLAIALAVAELGLRMFGGHLLGAVAQSRGMVEAKPGGTVALTPGYRGEMTVLGATTTVRVNAVGLRGAEVDALRDGDVRVLVLGDSMTFGQGVEDHETFVHGLGEILTDDRRRVQVLNGGVPMYGTREMALALQRLDPVLRPDVIVVCHYIGNDFEEDVVVDKTVTDDGYMLARATADAVERSWRAKLALRSKLWLWLEQRWRGVSPDSNLFTELDAASRPSAEYLAAFAGWPDHPQRAECLFLDAVPIGPAQRAAFDRVGSSLDSMQATLGGRPLLFVILPTWRHCYPHGYALSMTLLGLDPARHVAGTIQREVARRASERGIEHLDLTAPLSAVDDPVSLFLEGDYHFTVRGHRVVAELIAPALEPLLPR